MKTKIKVVLRYSNEYIDKKLISTPIFEEILAEEINIVSFLTTYIGKLNKSWVVAEFSTGLRVGGGETRKVAIEQAKHNLSLYSKSTILSLMEDAIKDHGVINTHEPKIEVSLETLVREGKELTEEQKHLLYEFLSKGVWNKTRERLYDRIFTYGIHKNYEVYRRIIFHNDHIELVARQDYSWDLKCVRDLILHD